MYLTCLVAAGVLFLLPLFIPMRPVQTESASYVVGFNNGVAILGAVVISVSVLLATWWWRDFYPLFDLNWAGDDERLSPRFLAIVIGICAAILALCGWLVTASHLRYLGDAGYIIEQATVTRDTGRTLYTQLEFAYGPLLLYPEVWLSRALGLSMTASYYTTFVVEACAGLLLLAYVLNRLPVRGSLRRPVYVLLALGSITPHLGLNYTFLRFASPYAIFLFATRRLTVWRCALMLCLAELVEVCISPELGLALAAAALVFGLLRTWQAGPRWLLVAAMPLLTLLTVLRTLGSSYLKMAATFSRGALNLPVGPFPHLLVYLFALIWLVPLGLAQMQKSRELPEPRILSLYVLALAFVPAALGRSDPLHVLFDGVGMLLLSLILVSALDSRLRVAWVASIAVLILWNHFINERVFEVRNAEVLREAVLPHTPAPLRSLLVNAVGRRRADLASILAGVPQANYHLPSAEFAALTQGAPVATPIDVSPVVEQQLRASHQYTPGYYAFWVDMMNPASEQRSIREVNACSWMLLRSDWVVYQPDEVDSIRIFQGLRLHYRERHPRPFVTAAFLLNLQKRWESVTTFGPYTLYHQRPS